MMSQGKHNSLSLARPLLFLQGRLSSAQTESVTLGKEGGRMPGRVLMPGPQRGQLVKKATVHLPSFHRLSEAQDSIQLSYAFLTERDSSITAQLSSEAVLPSHSITESLQLGIYQISKIESIRRIPRNWEFKRGLNVDAGWELLFLFTWLIYICICIPN